VLEIGRPSLLDLVPVFAIDAVRSVRTQSEGALPSQGRLVAFQKEETNKWHSVQNVELR
jgi:hypothetical protein